MTNSPLINLVVGVIVGDLVIVGSQLLKDGIVDQTIVLLTTKTRSVTSLLASTGVGIGKGILADLSGGKGASNNHIKI